MAETPQERRARNKKKREANERAIISGVKSIFSSNSKPSSNPRRSDNEARLGKRRSSERTMPMKSQGRSTIKSSKRPQVISKNRETEPTKSGGASEYYKSIYNKGATKPKASKSKSILTSRASSSLSSLLSVFAGKDTPARQKMSMKGGKTSKVSESKTTKKFKAVRPTGNNEIPTKPDVNTIRGGVSPTTKTVTPPLNKIKAGTKKPPLESGKGFEQPKPDVKVKMRNSQITTAKAKATKNQPSLETPQKGYGADNPNPRGETYGDRNDDSTMPDMLDKSTADEYREKQYDRVVKKFVRSMFGG